MVQQLGKFAESLFNGGDGKSLEWVIASDGEILSAEDLTDEERFGFARQCCVLEVGRLFLEDESGSFDLDRCPDIFVLPADRQGEAILDSARRLKELEVEGNELQDQYLSALDRVFDADRYCRGDLTRQAFEADAGRTSNKFAAHRDEEKRQRMALVSLLLQLNEPIEVAEPPKPTVRSLKPGRRSGPLG